MGKKQRIEGRGGVEDGGSEGGREKEKGRGQRSGERRAEGVF